METQLPDAELVMFPDASHASHPQYAEIFLDYARRFLKE
jgi:hypothetical protein